MRFFNPVITVILAKTNLYGNAEILPQIVYFTLASYVHFPAHVPLTQ